jgi:hypothetical protein
MTVVALAAAAMLLSACLPLPPPPPVPVTYLLYGDSLSEQSAPYLAQHGTVGRDYFGGSAPCNWVSSLGGSRDFTRVAPSVVLLQFIGNLPACMTGRDPTLGYEQDLTAIAQFWRTRGVPVVMVISPLTQAGNLVWAQTAERSIASNLGLPVRDAGQSVLAGGAFTFFLPCLSPTEPACGAEQPGQVRVRAPDGVHFDNLGGGYSAGGHRFGDAEA